MEKQSVRVTFKPDSKEVWVVSGSTVREALFAASIPMAMPCGGHGRCGGCLVFAKGALSAPTDDELDRMPWRARNARLACLARIEGEAEITIPASSRVAIDKIATRGVSKRIYKVRSGVVKVFLGKQRPAALVGLRRKYGFGIKDIALGRTDSSLMDRALRSDPGWSLGLHSNATVVAMEHEILGFEAGDTSRECYGLALDIGTNTVVAALVDLATGRQLGLASTINPQVIHGDDVVSRIRFAKNPGGLELLRHEMVNLVNGLFQEMARKLKINPVRVYLVSAVGNTAMQHILVGVSPVDLGRAPYRTRLVGPVETLASRAGITAHPGCRLMMPGVVGGFVGGDLVALVISQALHRRKGPVIAIDLGTNGEIVLAAGGRLSACSTAAGPAFEGERIGAGVRAIKGAIENVSIARGRVRLESIGKARPVGLCGSGLLSAVAELARTGIIDRTGRIRTRSEIGIVGLAQRVRDGELGREFVLSRKPLIVLRQGDIREVQLGKAAISAGIKVLSRIAGVRLEEIEEVLVAGGFGSALKPASLRAVGIVPAVGARIRVIGNSALEGAKILLTSSQAREDAARIAATTQHVELFTRPEFKEEFYASMSFPGASA